MNGEAAGRGRTLAVAGRKGGATLLASSVQMMPRTYLVVALKT